MHHNLAPCEPERKQHRTAIQHRRHNDNARHVHQRHPHHRRDTVCLLRHSLPVVLRPRATGDGHHAHRPEEDRVRHKRFHGTYGQLQQCRYVHHVRTDAQQQFQRNAERSGMLAQHQLTVERTKRNQRGSDIVQAGIRQHFGRDNNHKLRADGASQLILVGGSDTRRTHKTRRNGTRRQRNIGHWKHLY